LPRFLPLEPAFLYDRGRGILGFGACLLLGAMSLVDRACSNSLHDKMFNASLHKQPSEHERVQGHG
jgi:hypothetical protein